MIEFANVTKKYGRVTALDHFSMAVCENGIYCLLGRNGAGKTTLMKLLAGHIAATEGTIAVRSIVYPSRRTKSDVSFFESNSVHYNMKVSALINYAARMHDHFDLDFARKMAERFELNPHKRYRQLSFGMKNMLLAIIALANYSKVILLDEPTLGFDAIMRDQFNSLLMESYQNHPRIIIVSTHLIDEIAKVTEHLIVVDKGKLLMQACIDEIDEKAYTLSGAADLVLPLLDGLNCIGKAIVGGLAVAYIYGERIPAPCGVTAERMSLNDFFISIVGGKNHE
ncbi:MAG: ABC transporter ATP-binding protein [Firmicutes bacterium]|nr:ABC transporter ATP-binding protein [Bacillota bacterium]